MKKAAVFVLILIFLSVCALGETYSMLTFEELQTEIDQCNLLIWQAGDWAKVIIPPGMWRVGEDIPADEYLLERVAPDRKVNITLWPAGVRVWSYSTDNERYYDGWLEMDGKILDLRAGDSLEVAYGGVCLKSTQYKPPFSVFGKAKEQAKVEYLYSRYDALSAELRTRPEWEEVPVPTGRYETGKQIPDGKWTIWPLDGESSRVFCDGIGATIMSPTNRIYERSTFLDRLGIDTKDFEYIDIYDHDVFFTPYAGNALFGFVK